MTQLHRPFRVAPLLALLLPLALATGCSREDKSTNPVGDDLPAEILNLMRDRTSGDLDRGCMGCHNADTAPRVDLTTYSSVYANRLSVRSKINGGTMTGYLQPGEHQVITDWIDAGAPR
jgi:hypothetical protein